MFNDGQEHRDYLLEGRRRNDQCRESTTSPSSHYEFIVGGINPDNDRYLTGEGSVNYTAGEDHVGSYNPPRMWYLTINAKMP